MINIEKIRMDKMKSNRKEKQLCCEPSCIESVYLPNFSLNAEEFPEIKNWKVGEEQEVLVKIRMTGYNENKSLDDKNNHCRGDFDIVGIESKEVKSRNDKKDD